MSNNNQKSTLFGNRWIKCNLIGKGGQGLIYFVKDSHERDSDKYYALKTMKSDRIKNRYLRFKQEIETVLELNKKEYPGIFTIIDSDTEEREPYFVTDYYGNKTLSDEAPMEVDRALDIFIKLCDTVNYIHENDIVHRDLKPDNVILDSKGQPIILDYGLAFKLNNSLNFDENNEVQFRLTESREQIGSRYYIPPELENGLTDQISKKSDSYTLGKILYYLLTREVHAREDYPDLATSLNNPQLDYITQRILSKTIIVDIENRLSATEIKREAEKIRSLIKRGFHLGKINSICRFCGEGNYKLLSSGQLDFFKYMETISSPHQKEKRGVRSYIFFEAFNCNSCGHIQFFKIDQNEL